MTLERCGLHDINSHVTDKSKYLKYEQINSQSEAAVTAPNLSAAVIQRNLLMLDSPTTTIDVGIAKVCAAASDVPAKIWLQSSLAV